MIGYLGHLFRCYMARETGPECAFPSFAHASAVKLAAELEGEPLCCPVPWAQGTVA